MKALIVYLLTIFGLTVAIGTFFSFFINIPLISVFKKIFPTDIATEPIYSDSFTRKFISFCCIKFISGVINGFIILWITKIIWIWLKVTPSILTLILLAIPIIIFDGERVRRRLGYQTWLPELISGIGELLGLVIGAIIFL